jgi:hypothetical protein
MSMSSSITHAAERAAHLSDWLRYHQDRDTIMLELPHRLFAVFHSPLPLFSLLPDSQSSAEPQ